MAKTSTGLQENIAGLLCYVAWWVSGLVFLLIEPENKFVRFHAIQSIYVFSILNIVIIVLNVIPLIGGVLAWIISVLAIVLWVVLMVKAYQGQLFKLPWAGEMAERQTNK